MAQRPIMQFDVYLSDEHRPPRKGDVYEMICILENGYAEWIYVLFRKMNEEVGRDIVFINGAIFGKSDLKLLSQLLLEARRRMESKPESWEVQLGHDGFKKPIYSKVTKFKMNKLLDTIDEAIRGAKANDRTVSFNFWGGGG